MTKDVQVSLKNTKKQILAAYHETLKLVKQKQSTLEPKKMSNNSDLVKDVEQQCLINDEQAYRFSVALSYIA